MLLYSSPVYTATLGLNSKTFSFMGYGKADRARLVMLDIKQVNSAGGSTPAIGQAYLRVPNGIGLLIHSGRMFTGSTRWGGGLSVEEPCELLAVWSHCTAGDLLSYSLAITKDDSSRGVTIADVVSTLPYAAPLMQQLAGVAAGTYVVARPGTNRKWLVYDLWTYHDDDGGNHSLHFSWGNGLITLAKPSSGAVALNVVVPFNNPLVAVAQSFVYPLVLTYDCFLTAYADGMGAGKKIYLCMVYSEVIHD